VKIGTNKVELSRVHKSDFIYACPVKPFDILNAKNYLVNLIFVWPCIIN